jgi:hypothetical protein
MSVVKILSRDPSASNNLTKPLAQQAYSGTVALCTQTRKKRFPDTNLDDAPKILSRHDSKEGLCALYTKRPSAQMPKSPHELVHCGCSAPEG